MTIDELIKALEEAKAPFGKHGGEIKISILSSYNAEEEIEDTYTEEEIEDTYTKEEIEDVSVWIGGNDGNGGEIDCIIETKIK